MLAVKEILVSDEVFNRKFICDLNACKGACCVEGDAGAPLEKAEIAELAEIIDLVKPNMSEGGRRELKEQGIFVTDGDGDLVTPLMEGYKECIFTIFEEGIAKCSIEKTYNQGKIAFKKPISCHLYPIRTAVIGDYMTVNYNEWSICKPACALGDLHKMPVYAFLKEPLVRKFGEEWFEEIEEIAKQLALADSSKTEK